MKNPAVLFAPALFVFTLQASGAEAQAFDDGRMIIREVFAVSTDGDEDEPYFRLGGFCSGLTRPFDIEPGERFELGLQIEISGSTEFSVWEKDGRNYNCDGGGDDDLVGSVQVLINPTSREVTINGNDVFFGEETVVPVKNDRDSHFELAIRFEPFDGAGTPRRERTNCGLANAQICSDAGGICEQAFDTGTGRHDLCRWATAANDDECAAVSQSRGIWTSRDSSFVTRWPSAVPGSRPGACVTQMANIGGRQQ